MGKSSKYLIPLKSLSEGVHEYEYTLDDAFFGHTDSSEITEGTVAAVLTVHRTGDIFELHFVIQGNIVIPCDRCLDDMTLPVATEETLYVKFGEEYREEDDNLIVVPETEGTIDVAWYLYEFVALTIPLKHTHKEGECNPEMEKILQAHSSVEASDDDESEATDPRWNALKKLKETNN